MFTARVRLGRPNRRQRVRLLLLLLLVAVLSVTAGTVLSDLIWPAAPGDVRTRADDLGRVQGAGAPDCAGRALSADRQLRGMWLTTVNNIDWPSRPGLPTDVVKAEYRSWLDLAERLNHNAIFVHVRPSGDALWPSRFAPWSEWLTGRRDGRGPGWDPLGWMVAETRARNLEFHAWFNPYRASQPATVGGAGKDFAKLAPNHPLRTNRSWAVAHPAKAKNSRLYYNPGIPEARQFVEDSILDAVERYDIDGVHFDDFFYPYPEGEDFADDATFARYGSKFTEKAQWRRHNVDLFVREMSERIKAAKPWVKFGISPFGIWRNKATDPLGSPTSGLESYDAIFADSRKWVRSEWVDYIVPQLYWHIGFEKADYAKLLSWWTRVVGGTRVQLYIGQADYRVGQAGPWRDPAELDRQLALNARHGVDGSVHFSAKQALADRLGSVSRYRAAHYAEPALIPTMSRLPAAPGQAPTVTAAGRDTTGTVTVSWRPAPGAQPTGFAIYRVDSAAGEQARLVAIRRATSDAEHRWTDRTTDPRRSYAYCITALDRAWNEGSPSAARTVT